MTTYLVDTDAFIRAKNQHYGFDLCPGFWNWIDHEHAAGKVFSIQRVYDELLAGKDDLSNWAKLRRGMFLKPDQSTTSSLQRLSSWANGAGYRQSAVTGFHAEGRLLLGCPGTRNGSHGRHVRETGAAVHQVHQDPGRLQGSRWLFPWF